MEKRIPGRQKTKRRKEKRDRTVKRRKIGRTSRLIYRSRMNKGKGGEPERKKTEK